MALAWFGAVCVGPFFGSLAVVRFCTVFGVSVVFGVGPGDADFCWGVVAAGAGFGPSVATTVLVCDWVVATGEDGFAASAGFVVFATEVLFCFACAADGVCSVGLAVTLLLGAGTGADAAGCLGCSVFLSALAAAG